jgi:hypothetical protein
MTIVHAYGNVTQSPIARMGAVVAKIWLGHAGGMRRSGSVINSRDWRYSGSVTATFAR